MEKKPQNYNPHEGHRERMRERFESVGADGMEPHELLEMLLYYALPRQNTNELAHRLLHHFGSLEGVLTARTEELCKVPGIRERTAILLRLPFSLYRRAVSEPQNGVLLDEYADVVRYLRSLFAGLSCERAYLLLLDAKMRLIRCVLLHEGTAGKTHFRPKDVLEQVVRYNPAGVILSHNHPGGLAIPSSADIESTMTLYNLLLLSGYTLIEHIVIGEDTALPILFHEISSDRPSPGGEVSGSFYEKFYGKLSETEQISLKKENMRHSAVSK